MPLVSIIIPAYNTAPYIHRAIESSLSQTHTNIEVLVIDDGSTDDTLKVAQSFAEKDSRIRVFSQENAGVSSARNRGISEARGEYIVFLDSDDWFENDAVETLLDAQENYPDYFVIAGFYDVTVDGKKTNRGENNPEIVQIRNVGEAVDLWHDVYLQFIHSKLFKTSVIRRNNLMFAQNIHYGEDAVFVFGYLHEVRSVVYINKPLMNYLHRPDSATGKPCGQRKHFEDYPQIMINHPNNSPEVEEKLKVYHTQMFMGELRNALDSEASTKEINYLRKKRSLYINEYIKHNAMTMREKIYFLSKHIFLSYLPVFIVKVITRLKNSARKKFRPPSPKTERDSPQSSKPPCAPRQPKK